MRLAILGGAGFRTPLVHGALMRDPAQRITELVLHDVGQGRLDVIARVLAQAARGWPVAPAVSMTTELEVALGGADFVFSAIRVGGLAARVADERVALELGLLGQETTGPGGLAYALRTIPVALDIAERAKAICPQAWVINFTNPAGMTTEAMQAVLGDRVIGICDTPIAMVRRVASLLEAGEGAVAPDYVGLNHLGWLRALNGDGGDLLPRLLADEGLLAQTAEGQLFGVDWLRSLGALPNEYLYYYYFTREAVAAIRAGGPTRGEFLLRQQQRFYAQAAASPDEALSLWRRVRREREDTYLAAEHGGARGTWAGSVGRGVDDDGGYAGVALALIRAIADDVPASMILNVRGGSSVSWLPGDAVVEVPCVVRASGPVPTAVSSPDLHQLGLMQQVKAVERLTIEAATTGSASTAVKAFALHPLVDSVPVARELLRGYRERIPEVAAVIH